MLWVNSHKPCRVINQGIWQKHYSTLMFHLLDHIAEDVFGFRSLHFLLASGFEHLNYFNSFLIGKAYMAWGSAPGGGCTRTEHISCRRRLYQYIWMWKRNTRFRPGWNFSLFSRPSRLQTPHSQRILTAMRETYSLWKVCTLSKTPAGGQSRSAC